MQDPQHGLRRGPVAAGADKALLVPTLPRCIFGVSRHPSLQLVGIEVHAGREGVFQVFGQQRRCVGLSALQEGAEDATRFRPQHRVALREKDGRRDEVEG